jgi:toxin ParE1/3/4
MRLASRAQFTPPALRDLRSIWTWVADDSGEDRADQLIDGLAVATDRLVEMPQLGSAKPEFGKAIRCYVVRPYLIFYRSAVKGIEIIRVIDGRRHIRTVLQSEQ